MTDDHRALQETMGAYLLGDLDEVEAARLHAHLDGCSTCRAELASLAPIVSALADIDSEGLEDVSTPDAMLEQRVLGAVARERRRERHRTTFRTAGLAAAACLLAVTGFGAGIAVDRGDSAAAPPPQSLPLEPVAVDSNLAGVSASADLIDHSWGLEIQLEADGLRDGVRYEGVVRDADGHEHSAGAFIGVTDTTVLCNMTTAVLRDDAVEFVVRAPDGRPVLWTEL